MYVPLIHFLFVLIQRCKYKDIKVKSKIIQHFLSEYSIILIKKTTPPIFMPISDFRFQFVFRAVHVMKKMIDFKFYIYIYNIYYIYKYKK